MSAATWFLYGYLHKQADADDDFLLERDYLAAAPGDPQRGKELFLGVLEAGQIRLRDFATKELSPERQAAIRNYLVTQGPDSLLHLHSFMVQPGSPFSKWHVIQNKALQTMRDTWRPEFRAAVAGNRSIIERWVQQQRRRQPQSDLTQPGMIRLGSTPAETAAEPVPQIPVTEHVLDFPEQGNPEEKKGPGVAPVAYRPYLYGAGIGGATGAGLGALLDTRRGRGALLGGIGGAAVGTGAVAAYRHREQLRQMLDAITKR